MKKFFTVILFIIQSVSFSQQSEILNSYLAHIAAANYSIQLNNAMEAQKWLQKAPINLRGWEWDFLYSLTDQSLKSFSAEESDIPIKAAFNTNGSTLAFATSNGNINILKTDTFEKIYAKHITDYKIYDIKFSHTGEDIFICSSDTIISKYNLINKDVVWSAFTGTVGTANIDVHRDSNAVLFSSWTIKDNKDVGIISVYDSQRGRKIWGTEILGNRVVVSKFRNDGKYITAALADGKIILWDFSNKKIVRNFNYGELTDKFLIVDVDLSPNGLQLVAVSDNSTGKVWDLQTGNLIQELKGATKPITSVTYNFDGTKIFTGTSDGSILMWDVKTGQIISKFFGHKEKINSLIISPIDGQLISTSSDKSVKLWDSKIGSEFSDLSLLNEINDVFTLNKFGTLLATNGKNGSITLWDARLGQSVKNFQAFDDKVLCADFNDTLLVSSYAKNIVRIWNIKTGEIYSDYMGMAKGAGSCDFNPKRNLIAAGSREGTVFIWNTSKNTPIAKLVIGSIPNSVKFSNDGKFIAAASADGKFYLWEVDKFQKILEISASKKPLTSLRFSNDSKKILVTSEDGNAYVFETAKGNIILELKGHSNKVLCGDFTADDSRIATGSADKTVKLWDIKTGECVITFFDFNSEIKSLVFSLDNQRLYVNSNPGIKVFSKAKSTKNF